VQAVIFRLGTSPCITIGTRFLRCRPPDSGAMRRRANGIEWLGVTHGPQDSAMSAGGTKITD